MSCRRTKVNRAKLCVQTHWWPRESCFMGKLCTGHIADIFQGIHFVKTTSLGCVLATEENIELRFHRCGQVSCSIPRLHQSPTLTCCENAEPTSWTRVSVALGLLCGAGDPGGMYETPVYPRRLANLGLSNPSLGLSPSGYANFRSGYLWSSWSISMDHRYNSPMFVQRILSKLNWPSLKKRAYTKLHGS